MVPRGEQYAEVATDLYYGGVVYERHASLDPARYHQGLLQRAMSSGVQVVPRCAVLQLDRVGSRHRLVTERGELSAEKVVLATSGYTGPLTPWHQRRIIPIGSYVIATEPLAEGLVETLLPTNRVVTDSRKVVVYYRASPDRRRILFGGRVSLRETDSVVSASKLHAQLIQVFPQLASVRVSHSWMGFVGYTFDEMPHLGEQDGLYYSMGYCGSGVSLASYFGTRLGQKVLGLEEGRTALDDLPFRTRAFYTGNPWFLAPTVWWYRMRDRLAG
jgi:glycine/D-amino acid oxidase-like deaminating enzyme